MFYFRVQWEIFALTHFRLGRFRGGSYATGSGLLGKARQRQVQGRKHLGRAGLPEFPGFQNWRLIKLIVNQCRFSPRVYDPNNREDYIKSIKSFNWKYGRRDSIFPRGISDNLIEGKALLDNVLIANKMLSTKVQFTHSESYIHTYIHILE